MSIKINIDKSVIAGYGGSNVMVEVSGNPVGECLDYIVKRQPTLKKAIFDENDNLCFDNLVRVNGKFIFSDAEAKLVKDGDEIGIIKFMG